MNEIAKRVAAHFASRGNQVRRKDKDLMSDTGGTSKGRDREPHQKPPRDDVKNRHREKRKTKDEKDMDTQSDPDMKKSSMHPLDEKREFLGALVPADNYYRKVMHNLQYIRANEVGISEKDFRRNDELKNELDEFLRQPEVMDVVDRFDSDNLRPQYCAECLYSRMVFE